MISINDETIICRHVFLYLDLYFPNVRVAVPQKIIWFISNGEIVFYIYLTENGEYYVREGNVININLICDLFGIDIILYYKFVGDWIKTKLKESNITFPGILFTFL